MPAPCRLHGLASFFGAAVVWAFAAGVTRISSWVLCGAVFLITATARAGTIDPSTLQMTWNDEFDGTTLDTTKWQAVNGEKRQGHSVWQSDQVSVSDGSLRLGINKIDDYDGDTNIRYAGGAVRTRVDYKPLQTLFQQKFGYFEARLQLPFTISADYWAGWWLMAGDLKSSDTRVGSEIDILETFSFNQPKQHKLTVHWNYGDFRNATALYFGNQDQVLTGFHTFGLYWDSDWYISYIDNVEVGRTDMMGLGSSADGRTLSQGTALNPAYLLLSMEAALWPGTSAAGWDPVMPQSDELLVDYVRVYAVPEPPSFAAIAIAVIVAGTLVSRDGRYHHGSGRRQAERKGEVVRNSVVGPSGSLLQV